MIFNPLISLYDTVISDREYFSKKSIKARLFRFLDKSACRLSDIVILDTKSHIDYFKHELLLEDVKFELLPVGADERVFFPLNKKNNKTFEVMFVGKFIPLHGIEMIVESASLLKKNLEIHFTLIGSGQLKKNIKEQITIHKLKNICLINWIQYEELAQKMKEAEDRLNCLMSDEENAEFTKLYRQLVFKLHPDLNPNQTKDEENLWHKVQMAYKGGDLEEMRSLAIILDAQHETIELPSSKDVLQKRKQKLTEQIQKAINTMSELEQKFPFNIIGKLADNDWVNTKVEEIQEQVNQWQEKCKHYEDLIKVLLVNKSAGVN